jgi:hypothetical protein
MSTKKAGTDKQAQYTVINLSKSVVTYPEFKKSNRGWISYGADNLLPQRIIDLNNLSAVNKSIIENKVTYICGAGVDDETQFCGMPNGLDTWDDLLEKLAKDYVTFGGFCFQVIRNASSLHVSLYHTDFSKVRVGEVNDYGVPMGYYLSNDWTRTTGALAPVPIKAYGSEELVSGEPFLFYYKDYDPSLDYYPIPNYYAALDYVEADGLLGKFYRNSIQSGFTPSVIISMPSNPDDGAKEQFNHDLKQTFSGTNGANAMVVLWGEGGDVKPVITPFAANRNSDVYNNVNAIIFQKIISAHRLTSPTLAGLAGSGNLGGNANEIVNAYILYSKTVIHKLRRKLLDTLNVFAINNGVGKLSVKELDVIAAIRKSAEKGTEI